MIVLAFSVFVLISWEITVLAGKRVVLLIKMVLKPADTPIRVLIFAVLTLII